MGFKFWGEAEKPKAEQTVTNVEREAERLLAKMALNDKAATTRESLQDEYKLDEEAAEFVSKIALWSRGMTGPIDGELPPLREGVTTEWLTQTLTPLVERLCSARIDNVGPNRKLDLLNKAWIPSILPPQLSSRIQGAINTAQQARKLE